MVDSQKSDRKTELIQVRCSPNDIDLVDKIRAEFASGGRFVSRPDVLRIALEELAKEVLDIGD